SMHGADLGPFVLGPSNSIIKIMVWKSVISDVGIKMASPAGWAQVEIKRPNTVVNQWEELTFDFSNYVNPPADLGQLDQIIVFPDFNLAGRGQNNIIYFDNITFGPAGGGNPTVPMVAAPTPTRPASSVISLFSNAYTNVPVDTWRTGWSNAILEDIAIQGNATKKYSQLDFVGIETVANQIDATGMTHIHIDVWSADFTFFGFKLVDFGADGAFGGGDDVEHQVNYNLPQQGQWLSLDIPLSSFAGLTTRAHMAQYILVGQPTGANTIYVDNVYFYTNIVDTDEAEAFRNTVRVYPNPVAAGEQVQFSREVSQIEVFDLAGQRVLAGSGFRLNTAVLNPGVYVLKMRVQDGSIQTQKLVVK
ncbi:MAG TPA: T9SS type A sorting domain-containing protein, partial [Saprospiraceae bacterium]|nr:T9SS type A sorting domain-containing protein [Saprospiraceae bacterium]